MAGIHNGHLLEFPQIRVDCFTRAPPPTSDKAWRIPTSFGLQPAPPAQLYLLTHVHTDHLSGLSDTFTGQIICSPDTKRLLLKLESEKERGYVEDGAKEKGLKKYAGLKARIEGKGTKDERLVDRIETIPFGVPKVFEMGYEDDEPYKVTITLLDANHCPGSTMFLITSSRHAVLHTGDVRADHTFMQSLRRNPSLGEFVVPWSTGPAGNSGRRTLDRIYIDTSTVIGTGDMPEKEEVIRDLLEQMSIYPADTTFFLNVWCLGWEDIVKEVARHFNTKIHVDRYKYELYRAVKSDPFLFSCVTLDPDETRFHACERKAKCKACIKFDKNGQLAYNLDKRVVAVNMVEIKSASWELEERAFMDRLGAAIDGGQWPFSIDCPLARHSPLPELQALVKMFRPKSLSPNTMVPPAQGMDYYLLPDLFQDCLDETAHATLTRERDAWFAARPKFGKANLENLRFSARMAIPQMQDRSDRDEVYREPFDAGLVGSTQRGRRATAMDQLSRVGFAAMSGDLSSMVASIEGVSGLMFGGMGAMPGLSAGSSWGGKKEESDYDTEEESAQRKRKRAGHKDEFAWTSAHTGRALGSGSSGPPVVKLESLAEVDTEVKVEASSPLPDPTQTPRKPFRPFSVNKEHLRALAMVAAEVDDL